MASLSRIFNTILISLFISVCAYGSYGTSYFMPQRKPAELMPVHTEWYDIDNILWIGKSSVVSFDGKKYYFTKTYKNVPDIQLQGFELHAERIDSVVIDIALRSESQGYATLTAEEIELLTFFVTVGDLPRLMFPHYDRFKYEYYIPISELSIYLGKSTYSSIKITAEQGHLLKQWYYSNKKYFTVNQWRQYLCYVFSQQANSILFPDDIIFETITESQSKTGIKPLQMAMKEYFVLKNIDRMGL